MAPMYAGSVKPASWMAAAQQAAQPHRQREHHEVAHDGGVLALDLDAQLAGRIIVGNGELRLELTR